MRHHIATSVTVFSSIYLIQLHSVSNIYSCNQIWFDKKNIESHKLNTEIIRTLNLNINNFFAWDGIFFHTVRVFFPLCIEKSGEGKIPWLFQHTQWQWISIYMIILYWILVKSAQPWAWSSQLDTDTGGTAKLWLPQKSS